MCACFEGMCVSEFSCLCRALKVMKKSREWRALTVSLFSSLSLKRSVLVAVGMEDTAARGMSASVRTVSMAHIVRKVKACHPAINVY